MTSLYPFWCNNGGPLLFFSSKLRLKISLGECLANIVSKSEEKIKVIF